MNEPRKDEAWIERATALLDDSAKNLDASTLSRLNRARQAALAQPRHATRRWMLGAGFAAASACALVLAFGLQPRWHASVAPSHEAAAQADDVDLLNADDDTLDLYENLDFYAWLDAHGGGTSG